jgi:hypothetical protein
MMTDENDEMYLLLIETSGNQSFIFSTNKLRENVGASESTYRACSQWVLDAAEKITHKKLWDDDSDTLRANLLNSEYNPPIEDSADHLVEVIIAASGKAILLTRRLDHAQQIIQEVTLKALKEAPGLDVCGAIEKFTWNGTIKLPEVSRQLHKKFEVVRSLRPDPNLRFLRLPIVEDCRTSGLPASDLDREPNRLVEKSRASLCKKMWADQALGEGGRLPKILEGSGYEFIKSTNELLDKQLQVEWLAVIHADGNGLGQIFINFEQYIGQDQSNRHYTNRFRQFSLELDHCTRQAFLSAIQVFPKDASKDGSAPLKLVPLVLGGDDLTIVCDAKFAFAFTKAFLERFELETQQSETISDIAAQAFKLGEEQGQLSACAGIAIVKPHFPFSTAYQLAEKLAKSAKVVKEIVKEGGQVIPCSAIDFHVLYDTRGTRLEAIREKLTFKAEKVHLYNRPYVVSSVESVMQMAENQENLRTWLESHHWSKLEKRVAALLERDEEGRRVLPNSQMHALREGLFMGKEGADAQYQLIRKRYERSIDLIAATNSESLFWQDAITEYHVTGLLDAMDIADFWVPSEQPSEPAAEEVES